MAAALSTYTIQMEIAAPLLLDLYACQPKMLVSFALLWSLVVRCHITFNNHSFMTCVWALVRSPFGGYGKLHCDNAAGRGKRFV